MVTTFFNNIIFDLDGTLVDSFHDIYSALSVAANHLGLPAPAERFLRDNMHLRLDQQVQLLYPDTDWNRFMQEFRNNYDGSGYPHTRPYPGVVETLQLLHQEGCRLFVATNKRKIAAAALVARFDSNSLIEDIKTADNCTPPLSKREIVQKIITEHGLDPQCTVLVGDTHGDYDAAAQNEIAFIFAGYGYGKVNLEYHGQSHVSIIDSFPQLVKLVVNGHE